MKIETIIKQIEQSVPLEQFLDELHIILKSGPSVIAIKRAIPAKLGERVIAQMLDYWAPGYVDFTALERKRFAADVWPIIHLQKGPTTKLYDPKHPLFKHFTTTNFTNFHGQKSSAKKRGIPFEFDFLSWITWWLSTGKFDQRGVFDHTYQMCRIGDTGPYSPDNVYCATGKENRDAFHKNYVAVSNGVKRGIIHWEKRNNSTIENTSARESGK